MDEGELTNLCGGTWQGIEVLGNPNTHQYGAGQQGVVELKNGAKVKYADMGVSLFERGNAGQTGGGILRVAGAEFTDNRWGVVFYDYAYQFNRVELSNRSYVNNGTFNLTEDYPFDVFFAHAYVGFVNGVRFRDCTFTDDRPAGQLADDSQLARGIRSEGARFTAEGCRFSNLLYGIDALGFGESRNFRARACTFTGCYVGLSMRGVDNAQVTESLFTVGGYNRPVDSGIGDPSLHSGIFIDRSSGFAIEKDTFEHHDAAVNTTIGITAQDTNLPDGNESQHSDYNEIYSNAFTGLSNYFWEQGINEEPVCSPEFKMASLLLAGEKIIPIWQIKTTSSGITYSPLTAPGRYCGNTSLRAANFGKEPRPSPRPPPAA